MALNLLGCFRLLGLVQTVSLFVGFCSAMTSSLTKLFQIVWVPIHEEFNSKP